MTLIDTHAHLCDEKFDDDRSDVIARAREAGVTKIISMGDTMAASAQVVQDAEEYPALYAAVGIHPESACVLTDEMRRQLLTWAQHPKVVAIGEIGLDYYWEKDASRRALQRDLLAAQLDLAREAGLPVCIHDREAHGDMMKILKKMGWYIGIDGPLTYKNAAKLPDIVREAPADKLLVETDCPYLAPVPLRGKRNEPVYVTHIAAKIAEIRGETIEDVARYTTENAERLYPKLQNGT